VEHKVRTSRRDRKCYHCAVDIHKGDPYYSIRGFIEQIGGFWSRENEWAAFCLRCGKEICQNGKWVTMHREENKCPHMI